MNWSNVMFLNLEVDNNYIRRNVPKEFEIRTYNSKTYITLVFFNLESPGLESLNVPISFSEFNIRTYVRYKTYQGIYFITLDVNNKFIPMCVNNIFKLNYHNTFLSYDSNTQLTTIVLPYTSYGTVDVATRAEGSEKSGTRFVVNQSGNTNTVTIAGDITSRKLWLGDQYSFDYTLNKPYLKVQSEQGTRGNAGSGRFQVRHGNLTYDNSSSFKVKVTPEGRVTNTYAFESRLLNTEGFTVGGNHVLKDGIFKFPVRSKGSLVDIQITNDTPFPCCLLTMEYEATYYSRFRQT